MSDNKQNQVTSAGAVELEEGSLDQVNGGLNFAKIELESRQPTEPEALKIKFSDLVVSS